MPLAAASNIAASSGLSTGCTANICGWRQKGSIAREITVRPAIDRYCFGPPEPARSPRPAATIMAAVRLDVGIGIRQGRAGMGYGALPLSCRIGKTERLHRLWPFCCTALATLRGIV